MLDSNTSGTMPRAPLFLNALSPLSTAECRHRALRKSRRSLSRNRRCSLHRHPCGPNYRRIIRALHHQCRRRNPRTGQSDTPDRLHFEARFQLLNRENRLSLSHHEGLPVSSGRCCHALSRIKREKTLLGFDRQIPPCAKILRYTSSKPGQRLITFEEVHGSSIRTPIYGSKSNESLVM